MTVGNKVEVEVVAGEFVLGRDEEVVPVGGGVFGCLVLDSTK